MNIQTNVLKCFELREVEAGTWKLHYKQSYFCSVEKLLIIKDFKKKVFFFPF